MSEKVIEHFNNNKIDYLEDLKDLARIPSVSFAGFDAAEVRRSAEATAGFIESCGFENVDVISPGGVHPYVYGEVRSDDPDAPTVLLYAHHDVQPPGNMGLWKTDPFEPVEENGRLYGRGTADNKGGIVVHGASVASWLKAADGLPLNIKILVDGEQETGSKHLADFLEKEKERLAADAMVVMDTANIEAGVPTMTTSLRGLVAVDVEVRTVKEPLHSGLWGGAIPDAAMALSRMLWALVNDDGSVAITGLYDHVRDLSSEQQHCLEGLKIEEESFRKHAGLLDGVKLLGDGAPFVETWWKPSITVNAIQACSREDVHNVLIDLAWARVGMRIVPDLEPEESVEMLENALKAAAPWGVDVKIERVAGSAPWRADVSHPAYKASCDSLQKGYGNKSVMAGSGSSIPVVNILTKAFGGVPALLLGVEDPATNAHGLNENLNIADWENACRSSIYLYEELAKVLKKS